jgi:hypothetical protein
VRALLCPLLALSAWAQPVTVLAGTTCESAFLTSVRLTAWAQPTSVVAVKSDVGAPLASFRSVGVGSASNFGGGHDMWLRCSGLFSFGLGSASHCVGGHYI